MKQHIYKEYPLEQGAQAIRDLMDRKVIGKNVVIFPENLKEQYEYPLH